MEELTHDFLSFLPAALLTLAAAGVPPRCTSSPPGVSWTVPKKSHGIVDLHLVGQFPYAGGGPFSGTAGRSCRQVAAV